MKSEIRIGTRKSELSIAQTMLVADAIRAVCPGIEPVLVGHSTIGDKILDKPLLAFGGKGVFVTEFEEALLRGEIDLAVHSAKDLPVDLAEGLGILGALPRGDVRDVLVTMAEGSLWADSGLCAQRSYGGPDRKRGGAAGEDRAAEGGRMDGPSGSAGRICIGTSSLRRKIQIEELGERLWPGREVICENLRGNVLTRLEKLESGPFDGIILAAAGLDRLKILERRQGRYRYRYFSPEEMIPAGGQGILAIEGKKGGPMEPIIEKISDRLAMAQLQAERQVLKRLGAGCHEPVGVYCQIGTWTDVPPGAQPAVRSGVPPAARSGLRTTDVQAEQGEAVQQLLLTGIYEKDGVRRRAEVRAVGLWGNGRQEETDRLLAAADRLADGLLGKQQ